MTRINCIPPRELSDKHLIAEYRELPRVFKLARQAEIPPTYRMGKGHVTFFFDKLGYCQRRQVHLVREMKRRGFKPNFEPITLLVTWGRLKPNLWYDWRPTKAAMAINRARIKERTKP